MVDGLASDNWRSADGWRSANAFASPDGCMSWMSVGDWMSVDGWMSVVSKKVMATVEEVVELLHYHKFYSLLFFLSRHLHSL